jgi:WD40 repeat protein
MYKRSTCPALAAWCPSSLYDNLLALGSTAVTFDPKTYETRTTLDLVSLNPAVTGSEFQTLGQVSVKDKFTSLTWSGKGISSDPTLATPSNSNPYPQGVIAGGMSDGSVNFWSANAIAKSTQDRTIDPLIAKSQGNHSSDVTALSFHPKLVNIFASGSNDGEVFMWDITNMQTIKTVRPNNTKPGQPNGTNNARGMSLTDVQWCEFIPKLLTTGNISGETVIYDLNQKRQILSFKPQSPVRMTTAVSSIQWGSEVELAIAYNGYPCVEIWDFRYQQRPILKIDIPSYAPVPTQQNLQQLMQSNQLQHGVSAMNWDTNLRQMTVADNAGFIHYIDMTNPLYTPDVTKTITDSTIITPPIRPVVMLQQQPPLQYTYQPTVTTTIAPPEAQGFITNIKLHPNKNGLFVCTDDLSVSVLQAPVSTNSALSTSLQKSQLKSTYTPPPAPPTPANSSSPQQQQQQLQQQQLQQMKIKKLSSNPGVAFGFGGLRLTWGREKTFNYHEDDVKTKQLLQRVHRPLWLQQNSNLHNHDNDNNNNNNNNQSTSSQINPQTGFPNDIILPPNTNDYLNLIKSRLFTLSQQLHLPGPEQQPSQQEVLDPTSINRTAFDGFIIDDERLDNDCGYYDYVEYKLLEQLAVSLTAPNNNGINDDDIYFKLTQMLGFGVPQSLLDYQLAKDQYEQSKAQESAGVETPVQSLQQQQQQSGHGYGADGSVVVGSQNEFENNYQNDNQFFNSPIQQQQQQQQQQQPQEQSSQQHQQPNEQEEQNYNYYQFDSGDFDPNADFSGGFDTFGHDNSHQDGHHQQQNQLQSQTSNQFGFDQNGTQPFEQLSPISPSAPQMEQFSQPSLSNQLEPVDLQQGNGNKQESDNLGKGVNNDNVIIEPKRPIFGLINLICAGNLSIAIQQCIELDDNLNAIFVSLLSDFLSGKVDSESQLSTTLHELLKNKANLAGNDDLSNLYFIIHSLLHFKFELLIEKANFSNWKLIFSIICTYTRDKKVSFLGQLFHRLRQVQIELGNSQELLKEKKSQQFALVLLSILSGSANITIGYWKNSLKKSSQNQKNNPKSNKNSQNDQNDQNDYIYEEKIIYSEKSTLLHFIMAYHPSIPVNEDSVPVTLLTDFTNIAFSLVGKHGLSIAANYIQAVSTLVSTLTNAPKIQNLCTQFPNLSELLNTFSTFSYRVYVAAGYQSRYDNIPFQVQRPQPTYGVQERWQQILIERQQRKAEKEAQLQRLQPTQTQPLQPQLQPQPQPQTTQHPQALQQPLQQTSSQSNQTQVNPHYIPQNQTQPQGFQQHQQQQHPPPSIPGSQTQPSQHQTPVQQPASMGFHQQHKPPVVVQQQQHHQPPSQPQLQPFQPQAQQPITQPTAPPLHQQQTPPPPPPQTQQQAYTPTESDLGLCGLFESLAVNLEQGCQAAGWQNELKQFQRIHKSIGDLNNAIKANTIGPQFKNELITIATLISQQDYVGALNANTALGSGPLNTNSTIQAWIVTIKFLLMTAKKFGQ